MINKTYDEDWKVQWKSKFDENKNFDKQEQDTQGDVSIFNQLPFFKILYIFLIENTYLINKILSNALSTGPN